MSCPPDTARLFFALVPGAHIRRRISACQQQLDLPARPVAAANLHVTLAFLGNVESARIGELKAIGAGLACPGCALRLDRLGWFPRAGVVWLGSQAPPAELLDFQDRLASRLAEGGFRAERRAWRPHLTLYRKMRKRLATIAVEPVEWILDGFSLMRSTLTGTGAVYDPLGYWKAGR
jgi:2'-5' RNA ligase